MKTGHYDDSLSSLSNYLSLIGREGEHFEDTITLIVDAKSKLDDERRRTTELQHLLDKPDRGAEDGMVFVKG